jgi:two-component system, OmpR family, response regulator
VLRVLVVEDEPEMAALLRRGLIAGGYEVDVAADGVAGMALALDTSYDLAVLDVMLPGMSGFELCRRLRESGGAGSILLLTARDAVDDRVRGLDAGADDYLTKPFDFAELTARLRAIRRRNPADATRLQVGNVRLDLLRQLVQVDDTTLRLSRTEFDVLRLLAENEGQVLSRSTILESIWGSTVYHPNVVDQYISYLRRKLDPAGASARITTARGVGFRLTADG